MTMNKDMMHAQSPDDEAQVYRKSEADRYIAWLKYKRCEAMSKWCDCAVRYTGKLGYQKYWIYSKWLKIWLKLAEHYREMAE